MPTKHSVTEPTAKHTPTRGPWTVEELDESDARHLHIETPAFWIVGGNDEVVATVEQATRERAIADASLIGSAPELLAALRRVQTYLGDFCDQGVLDRHPAFALWNDVRAAIAKAEGR